MASPLGSRTIEHLEHETCVINAFIALDSASNVIGIAPTASGAATLTGPYTLGKGLTNAIGPAAGALGSTVLNQPHTTTGTYVFTLDEPWIALLNADVMQTDPGAVNQIEAYVDANVTNQTTNIGAAPGNNSALAVRTVRIRFRGTTGSLTDPTVSTGFWLQLWLKRSGCP